MKFNKKYFGGLGAAGILVLFCGAFLKSYKDWSFYAVAPVLNAEPFGRAWSEYVANKGEYPSSLEELVNEDFLPTYSICYKSYAKVGKVPREVISYKNREIILDFSDPKNPAFVIPAEHFKRLWIPRRKKREIRINLRDFS